MTLTNRTVIVTGAAGGIGSAMVEQFVATGARVVAADLSGERVRRRFGSDVVAVEANVALPADAQRVIDAAGGPPDVLCNNAGILDGLQLVDEVSEDEWSRVLAVNLTGPYLLSRRAIPLMVAAGGGCIVNTASLSGLRGARAGAAYTASKFGLVGLTQNIAATFGERGIRCNAICPGGVETPMADGQRLSERGSRLVERDRDKPRPALPAQIASVALFLASDAASHVNGVALPVDAGSSAF